MSGSWSAYYDAAGSEARLTLQRALELFAEDGSEPGLAVDLGCGAGRDTIALLQRGWTVWAIDAEQDAIARVRAAVGDSDRLSTRVASFADAEWPACDLLNASLALPFARPDEFPTVWERVVSSIRPGGRFSGHLFGDRDEWTSNPEMTFHARADAEALLAAFELEQFEETEFDGETATGSPHHFHAFHIVARKR